MARGISLRVPGIEVQRHGQVVVCNGALLVADGNWCRCFEEACWDGGGLSIGVVNKSCTSFAEP